MPRTIPMAFTDLLAASVAFMPGAAGDATATQRARLARAVHEAAPLCAEWPAPALNLWETARDVVQGERNALPAGVIGAAASASWLPRRAPYRADIDG